MYRSHGHVGSQLASIPLLSECMDHVSMLANITDYPSSMSIKISPPIFALTAIYLFTATLIRLLTMTFTFLRQTEPF